MKVNVWDNYASLTTEIILVFDEGNIKRVYNPITQEVKELKYGDKVADEFILKIPTEYKQILIDALIKGFGDIGISPKGESKLEGKLEATEKHLQDMRTLVFKGKI